MKFKKSTLRKVSWGSWLASSLEGLVPLSSISGRLGSPRMKRKLENTLLVTALPFLKTESMRLAKGKATCRNYGDHSVQLFGLDRENKL